MARIRLETGSVGSFLVSLLGAGLTLSGVGAAIAERSVFGLVVGLIIAGIGVGLEFLAAHMSEAAAEKAEFKRMVKTLKAKGLEEALRTNIALAVQVYSECPGKRTLKYIGKMNPAAERYIVQQIAAKKEK